MQIRIYLFTLLLFPVFTIQAMAQQQLNDSVRTLLEIGVRGFQERYHSPGIVVAIVHEDDIIFSDAVGFTDLENKIPATLDSKFQIQSITKMFTATMLMQLYEEGKLDLDDPVKKYVPEYAGEAESNENGTTLFELATHNSGLPRNSPADIDFAKQVDRWLLTLTNE